ncbi:MAG: septum site-determining protein MinD [Clostridia bacterium]|nr:septum site-determining protein MinD [Clostridia bacterium]
MGKVIVITSGKGGVGKSTTAASIGAGLAGAGKRTLLIDMDVGLRSLDMMLGAENEMVYDLTDLASGICSFDQALYQDKKRDKLFMLPSAQQTDSSSITPSDMKALMYSLKDMFDFVLLDCPAGIGRGFRNACASADAAILVLTPDGISLRSAERAKQLMELDGISDVQILINRVSKKNPLSTDECIHRLQLPVLGFIPEDDAVPLSAGRGCAVIDTESVAGDAFERIVRRLLGETVRYKIPHEKLFHKLKTGFGKEPACKLG